jgi:hypothetical protein
MALPRMRQGAQAIGAAQQKRAALAANVQPQQRKANKVHQPMATPVSQRKELFGQLKAKLPRLTKAKAFAALTLTEGLVGLAVIGSLFTDKPIQQRDEVLRDFAASTMQQRNEELVEKSKRIGKALSRPRIVRIK